MYEFCDECENLMFPSKINGNIALKCRCGSIKPFLEEDKSFYVVNSKINHPESEELISDQEDKIWKNDFLKSEVYNFICTNCKFNKAYIETIQTRRAHKGMTHYLVCLKCNNRTIIES